MMKFIKKLKATLLTAVFTFIPTAGVAASDVSEVTDGIDTLTTLVLSVVSGVGVIFLAWGLMDFGTAYASHDTSQQMSGVKKAVAGLIIVAVPTLINILT